MWVFRPFPAGKRGSRFPAAMPPRQERLGPAFPAEPEKQEQAADCRRLT
jgi:hypothetical protein